MIRELLEGAAGLSDARLETLAAKIRRVAKTLEAASPFPAFQLCGGAAMVER
jgi:hypothetical protein